jgi:hypothetical protein
MFRAVCGTSANIMIDNEVFRDDDPPESDIRRAPQQRSDNL